MTKYARVSDGLVVELIELPADVELEDAFHPEIAETMFSCDQSVGLGWSHAGTSFAEPLTPVVPIATLREVRIAVLTMACATAIVSGYKSSALGAPHTYPSGITDQINLMGSVTASLLPGLTDDWTTPFWCADSTGAWDFRMHTAAQIQQAGSDGKLHVVSCQGTLGALTTQVMAATTKAKVDAVAWPSEGVSP